MNGCEDSACQKYRTPVQRIATFGGATGAPAAVNFRVPIPDSRLRCKISLLFIPPAGAVTATVAAAIVGKGSLWLYEADDDYSGVSGLSIPCTNIEGTQAAPTTIPASLGLLGYSREFVSAADAIEGAFLAANCPAGTWVLQCRYQPIAVRFTPEEWREIRSSCNPQLISQPVTVP